METIKTLCLIIIAIAALFIVMPFLLQFVFNLIGVGIIVAIIYLLLRNKK